MTPLGLVTLKDELRAEAKEALAEFAKAGVTPKIISGDDPETVTALARQAGLGPDLVLLAGPDMDAMDDAELRAGRGARPRSSGASRPSRRSGSSTRCAPTATTSR